MKQTNQTERYPKGKNISSKSIYLMSYDDYRSGWVYTRLLLLYWKCYYSDVDVYIIFIFKLSSIYFSIILEGVEGILLDKVRISRREISSGNLAGFRVVCKLDHRFPKEMVIANNE